ncbi:thioredoxin domain-containing protein [Knoellia sp. 3-2P3]|uniref:thioredoxin domain-containing protein n=1 Tax=unclassified Knoellia TaxID=2618719 RepID=UPI0023DB16E2|nr:thioredoxin domain-containing protein [Knoellia sp. 3-2P3]MDF2092689.1 thioredoxin domain-containing protein [Knoellia sp. 3-2P3]
MANRLATSTSPYLLQHADNPVDWWEWCPDAFEEARRRDVPVLLSVGYAACHWCHVMAHQSFEDEGVAEVLNRDFVAVKVDREERPDIDAVYMQATTALTGQGGWPMTCFLTPDGEPFYCGTYFPRDHFLQLLQAVYETWRGQRDRVLETSGSIVARLREMGGPLPARPVGEDVLANAVARLLGQFDDERGGFGGAPKFPPSMVLEFLLRHHGRTGSRDALYMAERTCEAMARGGMYDQLGGGFARYSVDADWVVPHFEKMLYDNAQLLRVYAHLHRTTGSPLARRVALETAEFLMRDLRTDQGAFASALDADTDGVEGLTYAWTPAQLTEVLGPDDGARAAELLGVTDRGTFEHGTSTLQLRRDPDDPDWWRHTRERLLRVRQERPQPARDDKVVTGWNGLAVAGLSDAGVLLDEPALVEAAVACADHVVGTHLVDGRLRRASRDGAVGAAAGVLDDYGNLAEGLLALHQATADPRWLEVAGSLLDTARSRFGDGSGGFHDTADDAEALFTRPRGQGDNAEPSGQSAMAGALLSYSALTGSPEHRAAADAALAASGLVASRDPRFAGWTLAAAEAAAAGPLQVAVAHSRAQTAQAQPLVDQVRRSHSPGLVLAHGEPGTPGIPLLEGRPLVDGRPTAYVCRGFVCDAPVTSAEALETALASATQAP